LTQINEVHDKASCSAIRSATPKPARPQNIAATAANFHRSHIVLRPAVDLGRRRYNGTCLVAVENREDGAMLAAAARYAWKANGASCASAMPTMLANARKEKPSARPPSPNDILLRPTIV